MSNVYVKHSIKNFPHGEKIIIKFIRYSDFNLSYISFAYLDEVFAEISAYDDKRAVINILSISTDDISLALKIQHCINVAVDYFGKINVIGNINTFMAQEGFNYEYYE